MWMIMVNGYQLLGVRLRILKKTANMVLISRFLIPTLKATKFIALQSNTETQTW